MHQTSPIETHGYSLSASAVTRRRWGRGIILDACKSKGRMASTPPLGTKQAISPEWSRSFAIYRVGESPLLMRAWHHFEGTIVGGAVI